MIGAPDKLADYLGGEVAARIVLGHIEQGIAHPDALAEALAAAGCDITPAMRGFCRVIQKTIERSRGEVPDSLREVSR